MINACMPISTPNQTEEVVLQQYENRIYRSDLRTVLLYPVIGEQEFLLRPPIIPLRSSQQLRLRFDILAQQAEDFYVQIIHCQADWSPSKLPTSEYLDAYNEFLITDYAFSFQTRQPYVHYRFDLPTIRHSGNYLLVVYHQYNRRPVLSWRFMVYEPVVSIQGKLSNVANPGYLRTHQQIDWQVQYAKQQLNLSHPEEQLLLYVRQNTRWDLVRLLRPTRIDELQQRIEYNDFTGQQLWSGGNEFRFFDMSSLRMLGFQLARIELPDETHHKPANVYLGKEESRQSTPYFFRQDFDGRFLIANREADNPHTTADYAYVHFHLSANQQDRQVVFVIGEFNQWRCLPDYLMQYDSIQKAYKQRILLKQGIYNYAYASPTSNSECNSEAWEGTHAETQNTYEAMLYYQQAPQRPMRLIGYQILTNKP